MNPIGVLLSVVAGLVAIVAVVGIYNGITARLNQGEAITLLNTLRANVERMYSGQASYGASANVSLVPLLAASGKIPDNARVGTAIRHPFGGAVTVRGSGPRFEITFEDLDNETCIDIGQAYANRTRAGSGIAHIVIGSSSPGSVSLAAPTVTTIDQLQTRCANGNANNHLSFVFG